MWVVGCYCLSWGDLFFVGGLGSLGVVVDDMECALGVEFWAGEDLGGLRGVSQRVNRRDGWWFRGFFPIVIGFNCSDQ